MGDMWAPGATITGHPARGSHQPSKNTAQGILLPEQKLSSSWHRNIIQILPRPSFPSPAGSPVSSPTFSLGESPPSLLLIPQTYWSCLRDPALAVAVSASKTGPKSRLGTPAAQQLEAGVLWEMGMQLVEVELGQPCKERRGPSYPAVSWSTSRESTAQESSKLWQESWLSFFLK